MPDDPAPPTVRQLVTPLASIAEQVGGHVIKSLQENETVAVISALVPGVGIDRIVSIPLSAEQMARIQGVLAEVAGPVALMRPTGEEPPKGRIGFLREDEEEEEEE